MVMPLLEVSDLEISIGSRKLVTGLHFRLEAGQTLAVVGESGSGKSLTALAIMGLLPSGGRASGSIAWKGQPIYTWPERRRRRLRGKEMSMVFQEPMSSLNPVLTCGYQVAEVLKVHEGLRGQALRQRVLDLFEQVRLPDPSRMWRSYPHELSGGQKQRVMIAMAIACHPDLLIADEPTTALDVTVQKEILDLLTQLQTNTGMAMLFISHDLAIVHKLAHQVLVMHQGQVVEQGPAHQLFISPAHPYTRGLLACRPPLVGRPRPLPVLDDFLNPQPKTSRKTAKHIPYPQPTSDAILRVENLHVRYVTRRNWLGRPIQWLQAVDNVSFEVYTGEVLGLAGESGCGKSTLGRAVLALQAAEKGAVWYKGRNIFSLSSSELRRLRREIQVVFQDPYAALNPRMTIGQALSEPLRVHRLVPEGRSARKKVEELLERVGLRPDMFHRYPHEFSGGQRQRICIARALAMQPSFLVCDEAVSALDVSVQAQILNLLNDLREEFGLSMLFISHDLSVVRYMSHRVAIMQQGRIVELAPADAIFTQPSSEYARRLIHAIPKLELT